MLLATAALIVIGGSGVDDCDDLVIESREYAYVACHSTSNDFPHAPRSSERTDFDGIVAKVNLATKAVVWATRIGGTGYDNAVRIVLGPDGNIGITGFTDSADFPVTDAKHGGGKDAFFAELDRDGRIRYSTCLGVAGDEIGNALVVSRNAFVAVAASAGRHAMLFTREESRWRAIRIEGVTKVSGLARTREGALLISGFQDRDAFLLAVNGWRTNLPATISWSVALSPNGNAIVAGSKDGGAYLAETDVRTGAVRWSRTFAPNGPASAGYDGSSVAVDPMGRIWLAGETAGRNGRETDGFVAAFSPDGRRTLLTHYEGGDGRDFFEGIAIGPGGMVGAIGLTMRRDFDAMLLVLASRSYTSN